MATGRGNEVVRRELELAAHEAAELRRQLDEREADASRLRAELDHNIAARTARWHAQGGGLLSDGMTDDTLLTIARFLPTVKDLLRLQLTNKRFGIKCAGGGGAGCGGGVAGGQ